MLAVAAYDEVPPSPVVLLIDGSRAHTNPFVLGLESEGLQVLIARTGEEGIEMVAKYRPNVVVIGTGTYDMSGLGLARLLCTIGEAPVIVLSEADSEDEVVLAFEMGAADFLSRPTRTRENAARVWAAVRSTVETAGTSGGPPRPRPVPSPGIHAAGPVEVDLLRREVRVRGVAVHARPKEIVLLDFLVSRAGETISRAELLAVGWGDGFSDDTKTLDVHIRRLRFLVEEDPTHPKHLVTVRGYGHRFDP